MSEANVKVNLEFDDRLSPAVFWVQLGLIAYREDCTCRLVRSERLVGMEIVYEEVSDGMA